MGTTAIGGRTTAGGERAPSWRPVAIAGAVAALFALAGLPFAAFLADDLFHLAALEGVSPATGMGPLDLYTLSDGVPAHVRAMQDAGALPWFFGPDFKMAFLRPLSSLSIAADHALWGLWAPGHRLQAGLWLVVLVVACGLVLQRALPPPLATLSLAVFTISGIHGSLAWNATRHVVVAGALGMLGVAAHLRWRATGRGRWLSIGALVLGLAAGEAAFAAIAYLVAYEALAARGPWRDRVRAAAPAMALIAVHLVAHRIARLGVHGAGYRDPLADPIAFLADLPARWLFLAGAMVSGGNADLWVLRPDLHAPLVLAAAALVVALGLLLRAGWSSASDAERRGSRWLVAGGLLSALPFTAAPLGSRCLVLPMLGGSVAVAFVLRRWWHGLWQRRGARFRAAAAFCWALAIVHLVFAPIAQLAAPWALRVALHDRLAAAMANAEIDPARIAGERLVVLRAPDFSVGLHALPFRALHGLALPRSWWTLSWASGAHLFRRTGPATLELDLATGAIAAPDLHPGDEVALDGLRARVLDGDERGPTRVAFDLDRSLDDPSVRLLAWRHGRLERIPPPPLGGEIHLATPSSHFLQVIELAGAFSLQSPATKAVSPQ